ncbi:MAG: diaminopimelate decarboxylase [Candidatus Omnitrophota bacterium]
MHDFKYINKAFYCERVKISGLVKKFGTPLYVYSHHTLIDHFKKLQTAFKKINPLICYSVKANSNLAILKSLVVCGAGLDIVSGGELFRALSVKCPANKIVYASVGKKDEEIIEAIRRGILFFNVESLAELSNINRIAKKLNKIPNIAIRINPDVEAKTHKFITTGKITNKFGIDFDNAYRILFLRKNFSNVKICGLHIHIGSQITESEPFVAAINKVVRFINMLKDNQINLEYLNIGGGLGIIYNNETPQTALRYAQKVLPILEKTNLKIIMEPGRFIVGNAGILITKVLYVKKTPFKKFIIVDAGMNDLIRPALYDAHHQILPLTKSENQKSKIKNQKYDVVGPICESADCFAKDRFLPIVKEGDYLAIMSSGAYGFSMSSNYNSRVRACEVMIDDKNVRVIRIRETNEDLIRNEKA